MKSTDNDWLLTTTIDDIKLTKKKSKKSEKNFVDSNNCCIFVLETQRFPKLCYWGKETTPQQKYNT